MAMAKRWKIDNTEIRIERGVNRCWYLHLGKDAPRGPFPTQRDAMFSLFDALPEVKKNEAASNAPASN